MRTDETVFVAGGRTLAGAALLRRLDCLGFTRIVGRDEEEPDPVDANQVFAFFAERRPAYVFVAAGRSGGIAANQRYPAALMVDNLLAAAHLIPAAYRFGARRLLYLASSCSYPRECPQPMAVEALLTGRLEPTNEAYAVAKLAGIKLCEAYARQYGARFFAAIPANPFGPGDDFRTEESHVIPALLRRMHEAREAGLPAIELWGTGDPRREFIFADDLADACVTVMRHHREALTINLGSGETLSIREVAEKVAAVVGYRGALRFDPTKPDGMPVKVLDCGPLRAMGWRPAVPFRTALEATYRWFLSLQETPEVVHVG